MACSLIKRLLRHREGIALIEFALVFPLLFLLLFGGIEISRLVLIHQKLEKAGYVVADIVAQYDPTAISVAEINNNVFPLLPRMMGTYSDPAGQAVIITSIHVGGSSGSPTFTIDWQIAGGSNFCVGSACARSSVNGLTPSQINPALRGAVVPSGPFAALPKLSDSSDSDYTVIVTEVFYNYKPLMGSLISDVGNASKGYTYSLSPGVLAKTTYLVPRVKSQLFNLP